MEDILRLNGEIEETHNIVIQHTIIADFTNRSIDILGNKFTSTQLEQLGHWIDSYHTKTDEAISLIYKQPEFTKWDNFTPYFFQISDFPIYSIANQWVTNFKAIPLNHDALGQILSKIPIFSFVIEKTGVDFKFQGDYEKQEICISERSLSYSYDSYYVFLPLVTWMEHFFREEDKLKIILRLEYFNTPASGAIMKFLKFAKGLNIKSLQVVWYYHEDDEDMKQAGEDFKRILNFTNNMTFKVV